MNNNKNVIVKKRKNKNDINIIVLVCCLVGFLLFCFIVSIGQRDLDDSSSNDSTDFYYDYSKDVAKYKDEIELRRALIEAARAVGVAYGNGQQPTTTNLMWLR